MNKAFASIRELLLALNREQKLLTELFSKRKALAYPLDYALELLDDQPERLQALIDYAVVRQNGQFLEIDDDYLRFFELVLGANEEINVATIHATIQQIKENMLYFLQENSEHRRYPYLRAVKQALRKIGIVTLRNVVDLKRNMENTFKSEPNYRVKIAKLEHLDQKRVDIQLLIEQADALVSTEEETFFRTAMDEELGQVILRMKLQFNECRHNLIDIQRQIIEYLNQIKYQSQVYEKLRQLKYLKDQFTIRATTDLEAVLGGSRAVAFEPKPTYPLKLSLTTLLEDADAFASVRKLAQRLRTAEAKPSATAGTIDGGYLSNREEEAAFIDLEAVRDGFLASGHHLFDFVMRYDYPAPLGFDEKVTLYCQLVSLYDTQFEFTDACGDQQGVEYAIIYPK